MSPDGVDSSTCPLLSRPCASVCPALCEFCVARSPPSSSSSTSRRCGGLRRAAATYLLSVARARPVRAPAPRPGRHGLRSAARLQSLAGPARGRIQYVDYQVPCRSRSAHSRRSLSTAKTDATLSGVPCRGCGAFRTCPGGAWFGGADGPMSTDSPLTVSHPRGLEAASHPLTCMFRVAGSVRY